MRAIACALLFAGVAAAQIAVSVAAPKPRLISGEQIRLAATARDAQGRPMPNASFTYASSNGQILAVASDGAVTANQLGVADVTAQSGNARVTIRLQVLPLRIEVTPAAQELVVGDQMQYTARALNIRAEPIDNAQFQWSVTGANGDNTVSASIDRSGMLTANSVGRFFVRAQVNYAAGPGEFVAQFFGFTRAIVRTRRDFRLTRLLSNEEWRSSFLLRPRRSALVANESGQVGFVGALEGVANGLLFYDNGRFDLLASGGQASELSGFLIDFYDPAINNRGEVLARADSNGQASALLVATRAGVKFAFVENLSAGGMDNIRGSSLTRFSFNDNGDAIFRATYQPEGSAVSLQGLLRLDALGSVQLDTGPGDKLPGMAAPLTFEDFAIDNQATAYFRAFDGSARAVFRRPQFGDASRVIGSGDALLGSKVRNLFATATAPAGHVAIAGDLQDNRAFLARYANGDVSRPPQVVTLTNFRSMYGVGAAGDVVFAGDSGSGFGLYLWRGQTLQPVLLRGKVAANGEPVQDFDAASVNSRGEVTAQIRTVDNPYVVVRVSDQGQTLLFQSGLRLDVTAPLNFRSLFGGGTGPATVSMGGFGISLFDVSSQGLVPRLVVGDRLPDGGRYLGNYAIRDNVAGDLLVTTDQSLHRLSASRAEMLQSFPALADDGVTLFAPFNVAANAQTTIFASNTNQSHQRLLRLAGGTLSNLAYIGANRAFRTASPSGGQFSSLNEMAIDDAGRVMAYFNVDGGPSGYFLFDQGQWTPAALLGQTQVQGRGLASARILKSDGTNFYAILVSSGNVNLLCKYKDGQWTPLLTRDDQVATGQYFNDAVAYDANRAGDVALLANLAGQQAILLLSGSKVQVVHSVSDLTDSGDLLQRYQEVDIRDDRRVFFTAYDFSDHYLLYAAEPLQ